MNECMKESFLSKQRFFAGHKGMRGFDQKPSCMYAKNRLIEAWDINDNTKIIELPIVQKNSNTTSKMFPSHCEQPSCTILVY